MHWSGSELRGRTGRTMHGYWPCSSSTGSMGDPTSQRCRCSPLSVSQLFSETRSVAPAKKLALRLSLRLMFSNRPSS